MSFPQVRLTLIKDEPQGDDQDVLDKPGQDDFERNDERTYSLKLQAPMLWKDMKQFFFRLETTSSAGGSWNVGHVQIQGLTEAGEQIRLFDGNLNEWINPGADGRGHEMSQAPSATKPPLSDFVDPKLISQFQQLSDHLGKYEGYYNRFIWCVTSTDSNLHLVLHIH